MASEVGERFVCETDLIRQVALLTEEHRNHIFRIQRAALFVKNTIYSKVVNRMAIPLLYAHWEAFVGSVIRLYVSFISQQGLSPSDVNEKLWAYRVRPLLFRAKESDLNTPANTTKLAADIVNLAGSNVVIDIDSIKVSGNLDYKRLRQICEWLCIDVSELNRTKLDDFVELRRNIAHGGPTDEISFDEVVEWCNVVFELMEKFELAVTASIRNRTYLRTDVGG